MPVGPEFQNPPPVANEPPFIFLNQTTPYPWTVQPVSTTPTPFTVVVGDVNLNDEITVRWVANYPPYNQQASKVLMDLPVGDRGGMLTTPQSRNVTCQDFNPPLADNILTVLVSDRGFLPQAEGPTTNAMLPFSYDNELEPDGPQPVNTMIGWRIIGCQ